MSNKPDKKQSNNSLYLFNLGQLRHLYQQMLNGQVKDTAQAARGLLGPAIEFLEKNQPNKR